MPTPEQAAQFAELREKVQTYLLNPQNGSPYDEINRYFGAIPAWNPEASSDASNLLDLMRFRTRELTQRHFEPVYGTAGTITMGLPYFYPLNLTVLGWYVYGETGMAEDLPAEDKKVVAANVLQKVAEYDVYGYDVNQYSELVTRRLLTPKRLEAVEQAISSKPPTKHRAWYLRYIPFIK